MAVTKERTPCPNCECNYPGSVRILDEDTERCPVCQRKVEALPSDIAEGRCEAIARHLGRLVKIYEKSLEAELCYRDGIIKQLSESMSKLIGLDAELKSLGR